MKPTFIRVGKPKTITRAPATVRPPTEVGQATLPILQFAFYVKETAATSHDITLPDYSVGDYVFMAMQTTNATFSTPSGWTALMGPTTLFSNNFQVIGRVMQAGDGTTLTVSIDASRAMWVNVGIVEANGTDLSTGVAAAAAFWSGNGGDAFDPPSVDVASAGNYFVFCGIFSNNTSYTSGTEPSGYTQILENNESSPADHLSTVAYQLVNVTTTEDPGTGWGVTGGTRWGTAWTIAIPESAGDPPVAAGNHTHVEADVTDLAHWTESDHDALDHTGLTGVGVADHGGLTGLSDDDHTQYVLVDGTRAFTGDQSMGSNKLTNVTDPTSAQDAATKAYVDANTAGGYYEVIVSGSAPPVAVTNEAEDDWVYGLVP